MRTITVHITQRVSESGDTRGVVVADHLLIQRVNLGDITKRTDANRSVNTYASGQEGVVTRLNPPDRKDERMGYGIPG